VRWGLCWSSRLVLSEGFPPWLLRQLDFLGSCEAVPEIQYLNGLLEEVADPLGSGHSGAAPRPQARTHDANNHRNEVSSKVLHN
jgi:hypothetical protein